MIRTPKEVAEALRARLVERFGGRPVRAEEVKRLVADVLARFNFDEEARPDEGRILTRYSAADARAAGRSVPAHVPDCALLECDGLDARPDPDAPWMITMIPRRPAWVWDTLTVEPSPPDAIRAASARSHHPKADGGHR